MVMITESSSDKPPAYSSSSSNSPLTHGFPSGYFIIRNLFTNRVLDVTGSALNDGAEIVLWPEKEGSLVENLRDPKANNQVFFIDHTGALCSMVSGHAVDIEDGTLVLRHRHPYTAPFPNRYSHPLPQFSYDVRTNVVRATFACDPSYPDSDHTTEAGSDAWKAKDYVLSSVPMRAPPSLAATASDFLFNAASQLSLTFGQSREGEDFEVPETEVVAADRRVDEDFEDDNSAEKWRHVRVLPLPVGWNEKAGPAGGGGRDRERRRWRVVPLLKGRAPRG